MGQSGFVHWRLNLEAGFSQPNQPLTLSNDSYLQSLWLILHGRRIHDEHNVSAASKAFPHTFIFILLSSFILGRCLALYRRNEYFTFFTMFIKKSLLLSLAAVDALASCTTTCATSEDCDCSNDYSTKSQTECTTESGSSRITGKLETCTQTETQTWIPKVAHSG